MTRIEHLNITVQDMTTTLRFYQAAFPHWSIRQKGSNNWFGQQRNWLHFGDDYTYLTFNDGGTGRILDKNKSLDKRDSPIGIGHFAFEVTNLDNLKSKMLKAGFEPHDYGAKNPYRKNCYFIDPNGLEMEFVEYASDQPSLRNSDITESQNG
ncbi:VOC family protein [Aliiglaciecola sp.]|nr:VOC family protein [Aliiglaciecola sp.]